MKYSFMNLFVIIMEYFRILKFMKFKFCYYISIINLIYIK